MPELTATEDKVSDLRPHGRLDSNQDKKKHLHVRNRETWWVPQVICLHHGNFVLKLSTLDVTHFYLQQDTYPLFASLVVKVEM